jgi:hypothetical protein
LRRTCLRDLYYLLPRPKAPQTLQQGLSIQGNTIAILLTCAAIKLERSRPASPCHCSSVNATLRPEL